MENALQLFSYGSNTVRTVKLDGQIWFVAKDVADILGIQNIRQNVSDFNDDEKGVCKIYTPGGEQEMLCLNEPGLYRLIFRSNKPEAKTFQDWVYHEVLPALHNTGTFSIGQPPAPQSLTEDLRAVQIVLEPAGIIGNQLSLALDKVYYAHTGRSALETAGIQLVAPTKEQLLTPTDIGHHFGVSPQKINQLLCDPAQSRRQLRADGLWLTVCSDARHQQVAQEG